MKIGRQCGVKRIKHDMKPGDKFIIQTGVMKIGWKVECWRNNVKYLVEIIDKACEWGWIVSGYYRSIYNVQVVKVLERKIIIR